MPHDRPASDDVRIERDFLSRLVSLSEHESPLGLAEEALALVAERAGATKAYLEIREPGGATKAWTAVIGVDPDASSDVRALFSQTVMDEAMKTGRLVAATSAALTEPSASWKRNAIEEVLCVPIGQPPIGLVYLQGHVDGPRFPDEACTWAERFARYVAPVARNAVALAQQRRDLPDPTAPFRKKLSGSDLLVGRTPALAKALELAAQTAPFDVPILFTGKSGTGKSELARIITRAGPRANAPLIALNVAAIPENLLESELFGAMPGAFTGAKKKMIGKVELAEGGTLFLDEIGELSPGSQAKLLSLLQERTYWPLGATEAKRANVRIMAATNADLKQGVKERTFREDLYYRLEVVTIRMPPLDERRADIPLLADAFLAAETARHAFELDGFSFAARHALTVADWPGNVRQLQNTVTRAAIRAHGEGARQIEPEHCFPDQAGKAQGVRWHDAMQEFQRQLLRDSLAKHDGNVSAMAEALGIARSYAFELVKTLGLRDEKKSTNPDSRRAR